MQTILKITQNYFSAAVSKFYNVSGFSAVPKTDGKMRAVYHYVAVGDKGVQEAAFYRDVMDTDKDLEDIAAFVEKTRQQGQRASIPM